jgi:hypothetical protein
VYQSLRFRFPVCYGESFFPFKKKALGVEQAENTAGFLIELKHEIVIHSFFHLFFLCVCTVTATKNNISEV